MLGRLSVLVLGALLVLGGCGDDESDDHEAADAGSGVDPEDLAALEDRIDGRNDAQDQELADLEDSVDGVEGDQDQAAQDVMNLDAELDGLGSSVDDLDTVLDDIEGDLGDLGGRLDDLEEAPELGLCSEEESCIPDGTVAVRAALEPIVTAQCERKFDCCNEDEQNYALGPVRATVEECVERALSDLENGWAPLELPGDAVLQAGEVIAAINSEEVQVVFVPDAIEACAEHIADRDCSEVDYIEPPTDQCEVPELEENPCSVGLLVRGLQAEGEPCSAGYLEQCAEGLTCRFTSGPSDARTGFCGPLAEVGDFCSEDLQCDFANALRPSRDLFCNPTTGLCEQAREEGERCAYVSAGVWTPFSDWPYPVYRQDPDYVSIECARGLMCDPKSLECVPVCTEGAICAFYYGSEGVTACDEGLVCNVTNPRNLYGSEGSCREPIANGEPCAESSECESEYCFYGEEATLGECQAPPAADGGDCTLDAEGVAQAHVGCWSGWCASDGTCASPCDSETCESTRVCLENGYGGVFCEPKVADDLPCQTPYDSPDPDDSCASGYCADGDCKPKALEDGGCDSSRDAQCQVAQYCNVDVCTDRGAEGADCAEDRECELGSYCGTFGTSEGKCTQPVGSASAACDPDNDLRCSGDLECIEVGDDTECHARGAYPDDAACSEDGDCTNGWCADGTCKSRLTEDEDCDVFDPAIRFCAQELYCEFELDEDSDDYGRGKCVPRLTVGQLCDPDHFVTTSDNPWSGYVLQDACLFPYADQQYESSCQSAFGQYVCNQNAVPEGELFCDGD